MSDTAIYDSLTGAYSRALLSEQLHTEVERARRYSVPCSLMLFDLDHFKSINDAFGHARGDEVLCEIARRVQATIRASDQLFRYGGDEFVVLLPNTAKADAARLAQRLLDTVRATPFEGATTLSLTLSLGVATYPDDGGDEHALGDQAFIAWISYRLGYLRTHQGGYGRAAALFADSLALYRAQETGQELITSCLAGCAELRRAQGQLAQAARTLGYVTAHAQSPQRLFVYAVDRIEYERTLGALRAQLDMATIDLAWAEGRAMTMEQAIACALNQHPA